MRTALTIAGSDSGGGAGIQADLKTFHRFGVFGTSAVSLITAQNTQGVQGIHLLPPEVVVQQIESVTADLEVAAAKTGALGSAAIIEAVAQTLQRLRLAVLVVDPVMIAKGGDPLMAPEAVESLKRHLLPLATLITPNVHEAAALLGRPLRDESELAGAARELATLGPRAVLLKGGGLAGGTALDVLFDGSEVRRFPAPRIATRHTHGTGCTFSAAVTALLAQGRPLGDAVAEAKAFMNRAIATAPGLGSGHGPVNHWA